jgi:transcription initiation factor IIE alpha subunit
VKCKKLLEQGVENHVCEQDENEKKFKETAAEKGYQECSLCGAVVELAEACNHIS